MKTQLLKSFYFYLLTSIFFIPKANAQIVFTDVVPDDTITNIINCTPHYYNLDINNDTTLDFKIKFYYCHTGTIYNNTTMRAIQVQAINLNSIAGDTIGAFALNALTSIDSALIWNDSTFQSGYNNMVSTYSHFVWGGGGGGGHSGYWYGVFDKYLGLRIKSNGVTYYGWARLSNSTNYSSIILKDYAFNSIPNQPILAGQTGPPPLVASINANSTICFGDSTTLSVIGGNSFLWSNGETTSSITVSPQNSSLFTVIATDTVSGSSVYLSQQITVNTINTSITQIGDTLFAFADSSTTYQWINCATMQLVSGDTSSIFLAQLSGSYAVIITKNGCTDTSACATVIGLGINEQHNYLGLSIRPNPATNSVTIKTPSDEGGEILVINLLGETLSGFKTLTGLNEVKIDVSDYPSGMYVVRWNSGENFQTQKFSVMH